MKGSICNNTRIAIQNKKKYQQMINRRQITTTELRKRNSIIGGGIHLSMTGLTNQIMSILLFDEFNYPIRIRATFNLR